MLAQYPSTIVGPEGLTDPGHLFPSIDSSQFSKSTSQPSFDAVDSVIAETSSSSSPSAESTENDVPLRHSSSPIPENIVEHGLPISNCWSNRSYLTLLPQPTQEESLSSCMLVLSRDIGPRRWFRIIDLRWNYSDPIFPDDIPELDKNLGWIEYPFGCTLFRLLLESDEPSIQSDQDLRNKNSFSSEVSWVTAAFQFKGIASRWQGLWSRAVYCEVFNCSSFIFFGATSFHEPWPKGKYFYKILAVHYALEYSPYVVYLDYDAFFSRNAFDKKLRAEHYIPRKMLLEELGDIEIVFGDWKLSWINTGMFIFRRSKFVEEFLCNWWFYASAPDFMKIYGCDQAAIWHLIFLQTQYLVDIGKFSPTSPDPSKLKYSKQLTLGCVSDYSYCRRVLASWWKHFFGSEWPKDRKSSLYPFFIVHPWRSYPGSVESVTGLDMYRSQNMSYQVFHCLACFPHVENAFVIHTGSNMWTTMSPMAIVNKTAII